jgi:DNA anti-recombination protein RmuC
MADTMTRQDLFSVTELAKNKIIERLVTKYDVQAVSDSARNRILSAITDLHQENTVFSKQASAQNDQIWRKLGALEAQIASLQNELRAVHQTSDRMNDALHH